MFRRRKIEIKQSIEDETGHEILVLSLRNKISLNLEGDSPVRLANSQCEGYDVNGKVIYRAEFLHAEVCIHGRVNLDTLMFLLNAYIACDRVLYLKDASLCEYSSLDVELGLRSVDWGRHGLVFSSPSISSTPSSLAPSVIISDVSSDCPACPVYSIKRVIIGKEIYRIVVPWDNDSVGVNAVDIECGSTTTSDDVIKVLRKYGVFPIRKLFLREPSSPPPTERIRKCDYNKQYIDVSPSVYSPAENHNRSIGQNDECDDNDSNSINSNISSNDELEGCVICFGQKSVVLEPCCHYCCCESCSKKLRNCPLCRIKVEKYIVLE